jgi:hypothetical protein
MVVDPAVIIIPDFITRFEQSVLCDWARQMIPLLNPNPLGPYRRFREVQTLPWRPDTYVGVRKRLQKLLDVSDHEKEPSFGWFLGMIEAGGSVHEHKDPAQPGTRHLRCNLFLQLPRAGGEPVIDGVPYRVSARAVLAFFPSEVPHSCREVNGPVPRLLCSFGYAVPASYRLALRAPGDSVQSVIRI